ncbi:MAG: N-methyl-L-tryptophan oxidase [Acidobacteriota bacterium]
MIACDICIIGGGVMGASAACEVARCGATVALIDQAALPNPRAASVDHSKVFRFSYPDPLYVRMAVESKRLWRAIEDETRSHLLTETGLLLIGRDQPSFEIRCCDTLRSLDLEAEMLDSNETAKRFPQFDKEAFRYSVFDPSGAILHAEKSVRALIDAARRLGVSVIENQRVMGIREGEVIAQGTRVACGQVMVASGPWTRRLLPEIADKLFTTRQEVFYFEPQQPDDYEIGRFPVFIELGSGFYGFPVHHRGAMKIANHNKGERIDADLRDETIDEKSVEHCREFFSRFIPGLADARLRETRVCVYNNTADDDFIIDWHQRLKSVLIVTGFSGHGFKFGPLVGRIAADLLARGKTSYPLDRFSFARFV